MARIRTIYGLFLLTAVAIATAVTLIVTGAEAGVRLPNGEYAEVTISCDNVFRTLDYTESGPADAYYMLWAYPYSTQEWTRLTDWLPIKNSLHFVGPVSGPQQWYAFYASYAVAVNGVWQYSGEWIQLTYKYWSASGWWCYV